MCVCMYACVLETTYSVSDNERCILAASESACTIDHHKSTTNSESADHLFGACLITILFLLQWTIRCIKAVNTDHLPVQYIAQYMYLILKKTALDLSY